MLWFPSPSQKKAAGRLPSSLLERVKRSLKSNKRTSILTQFQRTFQLPRPHYNVTIGCRQPQPFPNHHGDNSDLTLHSQNFEISGDLAHSGDFQEPSSNAKQTAAGKSNQLFSSATLCLGIAHEQAGKG